MQFCFILTFKYVLIVWCIYYGYVRSNWYKILMRKEQSGLQIIKCCIGWVFQWCVDDCKHPLLCSNVCYCNVKLQCCSICKTLVSQVLVASTHSTRTRTQICTGFSHQVTQIHELTYSPVVSHG